MSFPNENERKQDNIYEEFSRKYKFSIKVLNSMKEIATLKEKYKDHKNTYSMVRNFRVFQYLKKK